MTPDTFVKTVHRILNPIPGITWNSVTESKLRALGRAFERHEIAKEEVLRRIRELFPLVSMKQPVEIALERALR